VAERAELGIAQGGCHQAQRARGEIHIGAPKKADIPDSARACSEEASFERSRKKGGLAFRNRGEFQIAGASRRSGAAVWFQGCFPC